METQLDAAKIAVYLLNSEAVHFNLQQPYTWSSGWKSPIYCDNRKLYSIPEARSFIADAFAQKISMIYPQTEVICGVATGAIGFAALVAERLGLPMIYVRSAAKGHGLGNLVEGKLTENQRVTVIEDLISTGESSLKAVQAVQQAGGNVQGVLSIFTYGFQQSENIFQKNLVNCDSLCNLVQLLKQAASRGQFDSNQLQLIENWRQNPSEWTTE